MSPQEAKEYLKELTAKEKKIKKLKLLNALKRLHLYKFKCCVCHKVIDKYYMYTMYNSCFDCFADVLHPY